MDNSLDTRACSQHFLRIHPTRFTGLQSSHSRSCIQTEQHSRHLLQSSCTHSRRRDPPGGVTVIVSIEIWFVTFALTCAIHVYAEGCSSGHNVLCGAARRVKLLQRSRWVCLWYQSFTSLPGFPLEWRKNQQYQHCQVKKSQHCQVKKSVYAKKKWYWGKNSIAGGG